jgi:hypothetical protein
MWQKQVKVYNFGRKNITDSGVVSEKLSENKITLTESFHTFAYECYKNQKLVDSQRRVPL